MIIKYPTGFYADILPIDLNQEGNITFTVSDNKPPRAELTFPQIPTGLYYKRRKPISADRYVTEPVYYVSTANSSTLNNNTQQFEVGQILDITTTDFPNVTPINTTLKFDSVHNLNYLNYQEMGLSQEEINTINTNSQPIFLSLIDKLNVSKAEVQTYDIDINKYQKQINETKKTIVAVDVMLANLTDGPVKDEMLRTKATLDQSLSTATEALFITVQEREAVAANISNIVDELNNLSTVVK